MADIAVGQQTEAANAAAATTLVINITPAQAGSSLHLPITYATGFTVTSVVSSPALTWAQRNAVDNGNQALCDWTADNVTAVAHTITITFSGSANYRGAFAKEIVNTSGYDAAASAAHAAAINASPGTGADGITTGNTSALSAQPALISAAAGPTSAAALAAAGTGFTSDGVGWPFSGNTGRSESKRVTATTALAATFTAPINTPFLAVASVFLEAATAPTTTVVTGNAVAAVGIPEPYLYKLDADPGGSTVNVTPTAPVAGSFSVSPIALTTSNWSAGVSSSLTASAAGSGNISSTNDGALANGTLAVTVHPVARPSAVTPGTYTDEAGGALTVTDINDGSDATGARDAAGADYTALPFDLSAIKTAGAQVAYFRGKELAAGKQWRQVLFANDGATVVGTGAWKTMTSTLTSYFDVLVLTGDAYKGEIQKQAV